MVSHEFRNPLNAISGFAHLLEQRELPPERRGDFFNRIQAAVSRMTELLDNVLTLGKIEVSELVANPTPLAIAPFCRKLIEEIKFSIDTEHTIQFDCNDECFTARIDQALLRQVLTNLLFNAIKYSAPHSTVQLKLQCQAEAVIFQVQDEGIGIALADQERLFESFYRASNVGDIPGTGLGLAIVKRTVEQRGGAITLTSKVNVGTTFTVTLPLSSD